MELSCCLCLEGTRIIIDEEIVRSPDESYNCCQGAVHIKVKSVPPTSTNITESLFLYRSFGHSSLCLQRHLHVFRCLFSKSLAGHCINWAKFRSGRYHVDRVVL